MRIFVANPPFLKNFNRQVRWSAKTSGAIHPPIYLAYAAALLKNAGHEVKLKDAIAEGQTHGEFVKEVKGYNPNIIVLETSTPSIINDSRIVEQIKKENDATVVFTGSHVSALPERTLRESEADVVCIGEYDCTLVDLAEAVEKNIGFGDVKGIAYKDNGSVHINQPQELIDNLDAFPRPLRDQLPISAYSDTLLTSPFTFIVSARGCPYRCNYCNWPNTMYGHKIRTRNPIKVVDEVEYCIKEYNLKSFKFFDDTFTHNKNRVKTICNELIKRKIDTPWICNARPDTLDEETMRLMKKAGCYLFKVGVESGDQEILNWIKKGTTLKHIREFFKLTKKVGIQTFGSFMIGYPQETKETIKKTFDFAKEIEPDMVQFVILQPLPGTGIYEWMKSEKMIPENLQWNKYITEEGYVDLVFKHPQFSQKELRSICSDFWKNYYIRPRYIGKRLVKSLTSLGEMKRSISGVRKIFRYNY